MSFIPLQGQEIVVDTPESVGGVQREAAGQAPGQALVAWITQRVRLWENVRNRGYGRLWANYWRLWRGKWDALDQNRQSERSRVITPALAQAIEAAVAEIEEAIFAHDVWFDVDELKTPDAEKMTALLLRDQLSDDMALADVQDALSEAFLNGAIFGSGIVQISTTVTTDKRPVRDPVTKKLKPSESKRVLVSAEAIRPDMFIPDPAATNIADMLGCAVKRVKPQHAVLEKIEAGIYRKDALPYVWPQHRLVNRDIDKEVDPQSMITIVDSDELVVTEWHGKVPLGLLNDALGVKTDVDIMLSTSGIGNSGEEEMVEALVTIANDHVLLRARSNPFTMRDRSIIAFQYEKVPGRFWGRGVAEKGYNPQIALDAAVRAYIDALGFIAAPMLGIDAGRIPPGFKTGVYPGKTWLTQGPPQEVLSAVQVGQFQPAMFQQASEMERMVQMGTGAFDTAVAINQQSQSGANSMTANSMLMGAFVKRAKRVIQNVDRQLLTPLVTKFMWRYMQFAPTRYPTDFEFIIKSTMGIMAREAENMQLVQLIGMLPEEFSSVKLVLAQGIIENAAITNKAKILKLVEAALKPNPQAQHAQQMQLMLQHAEAQGAMLNNQKTIAEIKKILAQAKETDHKAVSVLQNLENEHERLRQSYLGLINERDQLHLQAAELPIQHKKADAALISANKKPATASAKK